MLATGIRGFTITISFDLHNNFYQEGKLYYPHYAEEETET